MTILSTFQMAHSAVLVADCRLTWEHGDGSLGYEDVCQKIFVIAQDVIVGIVGDVEYAVSGVRNLEGLVHRQGVGALIDIEAVLRMAMSTPRPNRDVCATSLVVSFVDPRGRLEGLPGLVQSFALQLSPTPSLAPSGFANLGLFGSGAVTEVRDFLDQQKAEEVVAHAVEAGSSRLGLELGAMLAVDLVSQAVGTVSVPSVGGLYQAVVLSPLLGAFGVQYDQWVDVTATHGTYFSMRIHGDRWTQIHAAAEPQILFNPLADDWGLSKRELGKIFASRMELKESSPGVIPTPSGFIWKYRRVPTDLLNRDSPPFGLARKAKRVARPARMLTGANRLWIQTADEKLYVMDLHDRRITT
ncbi:MAG: hypothetical protein WEB00_04005 [Dehalococcoidia bacterium]